jgi:hypothetical protein
VALAETIPRAETAARVHLMMRINASTHVSLIRLISNKFVELGFIEWMDTWVETKYEGGLYIEGVWRRCVTCV